MQNFLPLFVYTFAKAIDNNPTIVVIETDINVDRETAFDILQQEGDTIIGGNTFMLRAVKGEN